jgi:hypothetical protein
MTNNAEREGFEKWAMGTYSIKRHYGLPDQYAAIAVQVAWGAWQARAQASGVPDESTEPRFFIDHGMIHDRDTGKHVTCEPDEQNLGDCNGTGEPMTLERAAADIDDCMLGGLAGPARMRRWKESIDAELAKQREAEPLVVEAVATVVKDDDGDLRLDWLLEGGICGLEDGCVLLVSDGLNEAVEEDGCTEVYTHPQQRNAVKVVDFDEIACLALEAYDNSKEMMGLCKMRDALKIAFSAVASRDREDVEAWRHSANDWADVATNGVALLENVRDGLCTANDAIALLKHDIKLVRAAQPKLSNDAARRENKL